jgi:hypothetical protein
MTAHDPVTGRFLPSSSPSIRDHVQAIRGDQRELAAWLFDKADRAARANRWWAFCAGFGSAALIALGLHAAGII